MKIHSDPERLEWLQTPPSQKACASIRNGLRRTGAGGKRILSETTGEAAFPIAAIAGGDRIMQYDGEPSTPASALIKTRDGDESITAEDCPRAYGVLFGTSEDHCESKNERPTQADAISRYS